MSLMMEDVAVSNREETVEIDAAIGPMMVMPATSGDRERTIANGMMLSTLPP